MIIFKNLKIRTKLICSFTIIVVMIFFVGAVGIFAIEKINKNGEKMYSYDMYSISKLHDIKEELLDVDSELQGLVFVKGNENDKQKYIDNIEKVAKENSKVISDYNKIELSTQGEEVWRDFQKQLDKYQQETQNIISYVKNNNYTQAQNDWTQVKKTSEDMFEVLNRLLQKNHDMAKKSNSENANIHNFVIGFFM